jgi:sensor c-di-GMP phosphodiesterase-like protein
MFRTASATRITLAVAVLSIAIPVLSALVLAHKQSIDEGKQQAAMMADEVLRRAEALAIDGNAAHARLEAAADPDPCSPANLALMREIDLASTHLQIVGYVQDGFLRCSSHGVHDPPLALGKPAWFNKQSVSFRPHVDLQSGGGTEFLVLQKDQWAIAVEPELLIDVFTDRREVSLGLFVPGQTTSIAARGASNPTWQELLGDRNEQSRFDGRHLVVVKRSSKLDLAAFGALPEAYLEKRLTSFILSLVPVGIVAGAILAFAVVRLARHQSSFASIMNAALRRKELEVHYQPIVDLRTSRIIGAEALLRWPRNSGPWGRPDRFVPAAEECGVIGKLTAFVIDRVRGDLPRLIDRLPDGFVSVNLSACDLHDRAVLGPLQRLLATHGIRPDHIQLEATEHSFVNAKVAGEIVRELRGLGIRMGIDDFGTGFSSLSYLTSLPMDFLKIDRAFVETVGTDAATSEVALHVIRIARSLHLDVIAEGVETEEQATFFRENGVMFAQGWLFGRAVPMEALLAMVAHDRESGETPKRIAG